MDPASKTSERFIVVHRTSTTNPIGYVPISEKQTTTGKQLFYEKNLKNEKRKKL